MIEEADDYVAEGFSDVAVELFRRGLLQEADAFVFCPTCEDVVEAWDQDLDVCSACGFVIPDELVRGMYHDSN
jgi:hypothetical protein